MGQFIDCNNLKKILQSITLSRTNQANIDNAKSISKNRIWIAHLSANCITLMLSITHFITWIALTVLALAEARNNWYLPLWNSCEFHIWIAHKISRWNDRCRKNAAQKVCKNDEKCGERNAFSTVIRTQRWLHRNRNRLELKKNNNKNSSSRSSSSSSSGKKSQNYSQIHWELATLWNALDTHQNPL